MTRRLVLAAFIAAAGAWTALAAPAKPVDVLIFTRWDHVRNPATGEVRKGGFPGGRLKPYLHHSTAQGAEEIRRYFTANGYSCRVTDDPAFFTSPSMKTLKCIVLACTNHELFDTDAECEAFYSFIKNGGGLLAIHSASANERGKTRFREMLGGAFERHYAIQQAVPFRRVDRSHPAMACLPADYVWGPDEIYLNHPDASVRPLLILEWKDVLEKSRRSDRYGCPKIGGHILEWCKPYGKGRVYYTALGHHGRDFGRMEFQLHLLEAARWTMGERPDRVTAAAGDRARARRTIDGAVCERGGRTLWRFEIANRENKPFIHPLCLPDGRCVTEARATDHPWHLGLWFCWKYINGDNYWEPRHPAAGNLFPDGMTVVRDFRIEPKGGACDVALSLWYGPRRTPGTVLLEEARRLTFSEPDAKGAYTIRSTHVFTARADVTLDARRPVAYGGFSLRMGRLMSAFKVSGTGGQPSETKNVGGSKEMTAVTYTDPKTGHGLTVKMLAPLATERIYTWSDHRFINPMPVYEKPLTLKAGQSVTLDYEVSIF